MVNGYLCAVDRCVYEFFDETKNDKFELMWRKMPDSLNWCATNAQMSVTKFTSKKEILMFKVKNMMERKKQKTDEKCTAVVISFDDDSSLKDLDLEINFAHTLPRPREENGFMESIQRLLSEKKFLLMGASKDRTDMHVNLFFENMDQKYCRDRYFRYLSYF
uniref:Protein FAR1-RELATED SEQUENCE n=1 Tax=Caenorhabditis tropicalis TaxID=1561998 RepID=A0A1I7TXT6_9PELO